MATQVGEATIKLSFDGKTLNASLASAEKEAESGGKKSGSKWGDAWSHAAGNLISSGIGRVTNAISNNMDRAVERLDTVMNAQHVFEALGYSADDVSKSMSTLDGYLDGLPTSLTQAVQGVQTLSASFGGIELGTQAFIDLNNAGLAFGATSEDIEGAIMQLSQLDLNGPLNAETWNSLQQRGFQPVFAAMAKEAGITVGELKESFGNRGDKTVKDFLDTLHRLGTEGGGDMKSFADLARENTNGVGTAMENVQNRIGKAMEKILEHIGQENISNAINTISYAFADVADAVIKVIDFVSEHWEVIKPILITLGTVAGVITTITTAISVWTKVTKTWSAITKTAAAVQKVFTLAMSANPIFLLVGAIVAAVTALVWFFTQTEAGRQIIENFGQVIGEVFGKIGEFFAGIGEKVGAFFQTLFEFVKGIFLTAIQWFVSTIIMPIVGFVMAGIERIKAVVSAVVSWIDINIVQPIVSFFTGLWDTIVDGVTAAVGKIKAVWEGIKHWIDTNIVQPIASFFSGLWEGVKKGAEALGEGIGKAMSTIGEFVKAPINAIIKAINKVIDKINGLTVPDWVPGIGGSHTDFGHIPELARGGLVSGATNAIIGEAGAEAVIPLERNSENWARPLATALAEQFQEQGEGRSITINVNNPTVRDDDDIRKITQGISQLMRRTA